MDGSRDTAHAAPPPPTRTATITTHTLVKKHKDFGIVIRHFYGNLIEGAITVNGILFINLKEYFSLRLVSHIDVETVFLNKTRHYKFVSLLSLEI